MRLSDEKKILGILSSSDISSGHNSESFLVDKAHRVAIALIFGPSLSGNPAVKLYSGAMDAAKTTAVNFKSRYGNASIGSANGDILTGDTSGTVITCTGTTFVSRTVVLEFDLKDITDGHKWMTLEVGSQASAGELTAMAILDQRYASNADGTILA